MSRSGTTDPIHGLSLGQKARWRAAERRVVQEHDADQMATLQDMAATGLGVTGMLISERPGPDGGTADAAAFEMIIDGRRVRAVRAHRRTLSRLREALATIASVPLTAVGRYGPYWVLTFRLATEQVVLLVEHLTVLPEWGGPGGRQGVPGAPLAVLGA
jgi:hypothetical protein